MASESTRPFRLTPTRSARDQDHLPWGKAYEHGHDMGAKETFEVMPPE